LEVFIPIEEKNAMVFGVLTGAVILFLLQFLTSLFLGRAFCGYICSAGGLQECLMCVSDKKVKSVKINIIKFIIWLLWIFTIIVFLYRLAV